MKKERKISRNGTKKNVRKNMFFVMKCITIAEQKCITIADILRRGCVIFSELIEEITHIVPFYGKSCITIASLALKIFRTNFLEKQVIGYRHNVNQSLIAICWLSEIEVELNDNGYELDDILSGSGGKNSWTIC